jgi:hypothetical protein
MEKEIPSEINNLLLEELSNNMLSTINKNDINKFVHSNVFMNIINITADIDGLHSEICMILEEFKGRSLGFLRLFSLEILRYSLKGYYISWITMRDFLATIINQIYDLGFNEKDIKWNLVLSNQHIIESKIPAIIREYRKILKTDEIVRKRNKIVHRGILDDDDINNLVVERNVLYSDKFSILKDNNLTDEEYDKRIKELYQKIEHISLTKYDELKYHYLITIEMISRVLKELGQKIKKDHPEIYEM